ncbi:MAG TPA: LamG domain-containing protein [Polyangia bacterium]
MKLSVTALVAFLFGACTMPNPAFRLEERLPGPNVGNSTGASFIDGAASSTPERPDAAADGGAINPGAPDVGATNIGSGNANDAGSNNPSTNDAGSPSTSVDSGSRVSGTYFDVVSNTPGLVSYWRMGVAPNVTDDFAGPAGAALQTRASNGHSWTSFTAEGSGSQNAVFTNAGRVRKGGNGNRAHYYSSYVPPSGDYAVEADLHVKTVIDDVSLIGRQNLASNSGMDWYSARFFNGGWEIRRVINDAGVTIGSATGPALSNDTTYRFRLEIMGTNPVVVRVYLNSRLIMSASDSNANRITAPGRAGLRFGALSSTDAVTDNTGLHLDNFRVVPSTSAAFPDSRGTNNGSYVGAPSLNVMGALVGDANAATRWFGAGDHATVPDSASLDLGDGPFTLEAWVKRNEGDADMATILQKGINAYQFGFFENRIGLFRDDGSGPGAPIAVSTTLQTDTTAYHHYVVTKNGAAVKIYVDGIDVTGPVTNLPLSNTTTPLLLGGLSDDRLDGDLDEVAIYNVALDAATVSEHHRIGAGR